MEEYVGKITGIVFSNKNTGFYVLKTNPESTGFDSKITTVRGTFPGVSLSVGLKVKFHGKHDVHPTYGKQLNAFSCEVIPENGRSGVIKYLTNSVSSIGPVTAAKLYDAFGDDLIEILDKDPERVRTLEFLTPKQVDSIIKEWSEVSELRNSSIYLSNLGLTSSQIRSAYTMFGVNTRSMVTENPYILCSCPGVGFVTADAASRKLGIGVDDPKRILAMILFSIKEMENIEGHMYVTSDQISEFVSKRILKYGCEPFSHGDYLSDNHLYSSLVILADKKEIILDDNRIFLAKNYLIEVESAQRLSRSIRQDPRDFGNISDILKDFESDSKVSFSNEQREAFMLLNKSRVCVITGFPGTGKTTMISAFVHLFEKTNIHYTLLSPTGIAAKRLSQVTGKNASTIHRALGYKKDGTWEFHSGNKYASDAVIIDEMSMVDASTFHHLITSLPDSTVIIMVGDPEQLPSVGAGYVLQNLIHCPDISHVALKRIYRQGKTSDIITVAHSILNGNPIDTSFNKESEFVFLQYPKDQIVEEIRKLSSLLKERGKNFQVLAPMHNGDLGVNNLNQELREVLNPGVTDSNQPYVKSGETGFYVGDRVMVIKNDYDRMVFNGDVGKITRISLKDDAVDVKIFDWFDYESSTPRYISKIMTYNIEEARNMLKVAYACTIHKYQGREMDYIILPMTSQYGIMLYRNLIYTAITRAKKKVFVFGDPNAFLYAVKNDREVVRNSKLASLIHDYSDIEAAKQVHDA